MKAENMSTRFAYAVAGGAVIFACLTSPAVAAGELKDVSKQISDARGSVLSAEVMLVPRGVSFRTRLGENDLSRNSCTYEVSEKQDLDSLLDTLAHAAIVEVAEPKARLDARIGVFLHASDGSVVRLVTGPDYDNAPSSGIFDRTTPVVAQKGFESDMRIWAAQRKPSRRSYFCEAG
jgi:hypothetical protein